MLRKINEPYCRWCSTPGRRLCLRAAGWSRCTRPRYSRRRRTGSLAAPARGSQSRLKPSGERREPSQCSVPRLLKIKKHKRKRRCFLFKYTNFKQMICCCSAICRWWSWHRYLSSIVDVLLPLVLPCHCCRVTEAVTTRLHTFSRSPSPHPSNPAKNLYHCVKLRGLFKHTNRILIRVDNASIV